MFEDFLPLVTKPARYINTEINAVHKDLSRVRTTFCLFFPDTYEVGMSHLGLRILYDILNSREDTACERVFSPWTDYEEKLRAAQRPLSSLESNTPLAKFDIVGITLQYELSYSNILTGLQLARIPLHADDRTDEHPVIIAGGPCAVNPEPLSDFVDCFFIGEAEEAIHELIDLKQKQSSRREYLQALSKCAGFYVPAFSSMVHRRYLKNLDAAPYPARPLLPLLKPVHDRIAVEVARGCIRGCRFCQAGIIYRPIRERGPERIKNILRESLACTGYEEVSLASLSSGDYSEIQPLVSELLDEYRESRVSISLPSLRVGTLTPEIVRAIAGMRKTGFTLAPEAGSERLRRVINKPVSDQELLKTVETIFSNGWSVLKLYFMIGLPTETDQDLDGIIRIGNEILAAGKRATRRHVQINISVSTFVPKPHTPFQWFGQAPLEEIRRKQTYLARGLRKKGINLKFHDPETSLLEAAFARGDRSIGRVLEEAVRRGCRFDGWSECFDFRKWSDAFAACGVDVAAYACRVFTPEAALPWERVQTGVTKNFLQQEYLRAAAAETTENCRTECRHCGIGCSDGGKRSLGRSPLETKAARGTGFEKPKQPSGQEITTRIRMKYAKTGRVRFLSHLDLLTLIQRTTMRAGVPVAFSQGFNPHPRIAFGPALPVGIGSEAEYLDMETDPFIDLNQITANLNKSLPEGLRILEARAIPRTTPSLSGSISRYEYAVRVPGAWTAGIDERVERFLSRDSIMVTRETSSKEIRPCIESVLITRSGQQAMLAITISDKNSVRPRIQDVIEHLFDIKPEQAVLFDIRRTALYYRQGGLWANPMDV